MRQQPVLVAKRIACRKDHLRRIGEHGFQWQDIGLLHAARRTDLAEAGAAQQVTDQRIWPRHDPARLPDDGCNRRGAGRGQGTDQRGVDPLDDGPAAFGMARQSRQPHDLRPAFSNR